MKKIYVVLTSDVGIVSVKEFNVLSEDSEVYNVISTYLRSYEKSDPDVFEERADAYRKACRILVRNQKALAADMIANTRNMQELINEGLGR